MIVTIRYDGAAQSVPPLARVEGNTIGVHEAVGRIVADFIGSHSVKRLIIDIDHDGQPAAERGQEES